MGEIGIGHPAGRRAGDLKVAVIVLAVRQRDQGIVTCFLPPRGADIADRSTNTTVVGGIRPGRMEKMPMVQRGLCRLKHDIDTIALVDVDRELQIVASYDMITTCLSDAIRRLGGDTISTL